MSSPTVGIIGGGQLARMTAQSAISLAIEIKLLAVDSTDPACVAVGTVEFGDPGDIDVIRRFAHGCGVVTFDHERVDPAAVAAVEAEGVLVHPRSEVLRFADKAHQRVELAAAGLPVPPFRIVTTAAEVDDFAAVHGWPVVAKTAVGGYDGRGVFVLDDPAAARGTMAQLDGHRVVLEPMLNIVSEIAVVVARRRSGGTVTWPVVETIQRDGICIETVVPATVDPNLRDEAVALATSIADRIGCAGILAVEFFVTDEGLVVNELAPRPHNSGHWTIEGAATSQFENHLRGILDWPLGDTSPTAPAVAMVNVLGGRTDLDPAERLPAALGISSAHVHLYDKAVRPGRKVGHVTATGPDRETALDSARASALTLTTQGAPT